MKNYHKYKKHQKNIIQQIDQDMEPPGTPDFFSVDVPLFEKRSGDE